MRSVEINNINYEMVSDFKYDQDVRLSFNKLTEATFHFSLENWYQQGYWGDYYIPYSLLYNNQVVSNVSITIVELQFEKEIKKGIQIGTVMTDENYRHRGLNKFLLEHIINEWKEQSDLIYLFANDSVLDFYPKFNFERVDEHQYSKSLASNNSTPSLKKLDMENPGERALLVETLESSVPNSKVSMLNNTELVMFYGLSFKSNDIFYIQEFDAIVIVDFYGDTLFLNEVYSKGEVKLNELIEAISGQNINRVVLGFTPLHDEGFDRSLLKEGDTLFMLKGMDNSFKNNYWIFPVLSHA